MVEESLEIRTQDGTADALLYRPDDGSQRPGVLFFTDIGGIRPSQRDKARELAEAGYVVLMPNIFYRSGKPPVLPPRGEVDDDTRMKRIGELRAALPSDAIERDVAAYVDTLAASPYVANGPIGAVGYCFSGKMALAAAAVRPEKVGAAATFHAGHLVTDEPTSPHRSLPRIRAALYFGHATNDASMPAEAIETLDKALADWGGDYESEVYDGAFHSWTETDSPVYNPEQAKRAFEKLKELFATLS